VGGSLGGPPARPSRAAARSAPVLAVYAVAMRSRARRALALAPVRDCQQAAGLLAHGRILQAVRLTVPAMPPAPPRCYAARERAASRSDPTTQRRSDGTRPTRAAHASPVPQAPPQTATTPDGRATGARDPAKHHPIVVVPLRMVRANRPAARFHRCLFRPWRFCLVGVCLWAAVTP
jgi:hypothetical protein